jgi:hypothetical protein
VAGWWRARPTQLFSKNAFVLQLVGLLLLTAIPRLQAGELWVAVGDAGLRTTSADGRTWDHAQTWSNATDPLCGIAEGRGRFIAVGGSESTGHLLASADGHTWRELRCLPKKVGAIAFGQNRFVAAQGPQLLVSTDGETFSAGERLETNAPADALQIACGDTEAGFRFVVIGESVPFAGGPHDYWRAVTGDGTRVDSFSPQPPAFGLAYGAGHFVVVGRNRIESSHDGQTWALQPCPGDLFTAVVWTGARFIATTAGAIWTSPDALSWRRESVPDSPRILWARDTPSPLVLANNAAGLLEFTTDFRAWQMAGSKAPVIRAIAHRASPSD